MVKNSDGGATVGIPEVGMYRVAVDIGGTFTDCVVLDDDGTTTTSKSPTTASDPSEGVMDAVRTAADALGLTLEELLGSTTHFVHGCTIATNAMIERTGVPTGLITTRGLEDTIPSGRTLLKNAGLTEREIIHISERDKPDPPLIEREFIIGISERLDYRGEVVVPISHVDVEMAADTLVGKGVEAIAICFLWGFLNPVHETQARDIIHDRYPDIYVSTASDLVPVIGEYERFVTTVINAYVGPRMADYLAALEQRLAENGYPYPLLVVQAAGGLTTAQDARVRAVMTLDSGPVGGTLGAKFLGRAYGEENIICTDVGGTSFDVSLIYRGEMQSESAPVLDQYTFRIPKILIKSIGAGGGSIAWLDEEGLLRVGPESAHAIPGPACYGHGGNRPTVTDADLVLGYLNPDYFLGGRLKLDRGRAEHVIQELADQIGSDPVDVAHGIFRIQNAQMADLIRKATIERGYDPRDFVLFAYGGAGPTHAAYYGRDAGVRSVQVLADSTVFSAYGMLTSDVIHTFEASAPMKSPFDAADFKRMNEVLAQLTDRVHEQFYVEGIAPEQVTIRRLLAARFRLQRHELEIELPSQQLEESDDELIRRLFDDKYTAVYGPGTGYRRLGIEVMTFRIEGSHSPFSIEIRRGSMGGRDPSECLKTRRLAFFEGQGFVDTDIFNGESLRAGHVIPGPSIIERMGDSVLIPPGFSGAVDEFLNLSIARTDS